MRIVAKTAPVRQWEVARELRTRVKAALDADGLDTEALPSAATPAVEINAPEPPGESGN